MAGSRLQICSYAASLCAFVKLARKEGFGEAISRSRASFSETGGPSFEINHGKGDGASHMTSFESASAENAEHGAYQAMPSRDDEESDLTSAH